MAVIIKNMKLPKNCYECPLYAKNNKKGFCNLMFLLTIYGGYIGDTKDIQNYGIKHNVKKSRKHNCLLGVKYGR